MVALLSPVAASSSPLITCERPSDRERPSPAEYFNDADVTNDQGIESSAPFTPYTGARTLRSTGPSAPAAFPTWDHGPHSGKSMGHAISFIQALILPRNTCSTKRISAAPLLLITRCRNATTPLMVRYSHVIPLVAECRSNRFAGTCPRTGEA